VNSLVQVHDVGLHISLVFVPCHLVDADRCGFLQIEDSLMQQLAVDVI